MEKVQVNRLRRMAGRQLLRLEKNKRRDPFAADFGFYSLVDQADVVVMQHTDLDRIEGFLRDPARLKNRREAGSQHKTA